ncbi:glycosyltransferase [Aquabacterium sp.]|uniref:glycosyltransferase n=1 Tax=Aquabacterium sp. TaxID=1872578 RepID=UPI003D6D7D77
MARFLLSWELGGGLGHAGRLKPLTQELMRRGHHVDLVLRELVHTHTLLKDLKVRTLQAPVWMHRVVGLPDPQATLAEILLANGYFGVDALNALVQGWKAALELTRPDVLVADYSPTAFLAARILGIPTATVGIGFYLPPDRAPMPLFRDWEPIAKGRVEHSEGEVLRTVNAVLQMNGARPVEQLSTILRGERPLLCTWPELDHYRRGALPEGQRYHGPTFLPSGGQTPTWPPGEGPRVFAYVRSAHPDHAAVLKALDDLGCRTLCYLPEVAGGMTPPVVSANIHYASGPVHLGQTFPDCQLVICHAGEATLAQSLLAGVPVLLLPTQAEQFMMARCVEETGAGVNAAQRKRPTDFKALIQQMLNTPGHAQAARAVADRYKNFTHEGQTLALVDEFESLASGAA